MKRKDYETPSVLLTYVQNESAFLAGSPIKFGSEVKVTPFESVSCDTEEFEVSFD
ncbi:MAG: hypothetical protein MJZ09_08595 [Bacteroidales bacterium]|nr:hypothetical protein [Bacteroidales bacterium]